MEEPSLFYVQHQLDLWHEQETPLVETQHDIQLRRLHEALTPYINPVALRRLVAQHEDITHALHTNHPPEEVQVLLQTLAALLTPHRREHIRSPADIAGLLMVEMATLDQEELRTVLLDTKNRVQGIATVYRGAVDRSMVRIGEVFKAAIHCNSVAIIVAHNHPSGEVTPSPVIWRIVTPISHFCFSAARGWAAFRVFSRRILPQLSLTGQGQDEGALGQQVVALRASF